jgi:hypothetical protein
MCRGDGNYEISKGGIFIHLLNRQSPIEMGDYFLTLKTTNIKILQVLVYRLHNIYKRLQGNII